jgi:hypothetical protein
MKYVYQGPVNSSVTLKLAGGKEQDVVLIRGGQVDVPEDNEYIKTLVALKHLVPFKPAASVPAKKDGDSDSSKKGAQ